MPEAIGAVARVHRRPHPGPLAPGHDAGLYAGDDLLLAAVPQCAGDERVLGPQRESDLSRTAATGHHVLRRCSQPGRTGGQLEGDFVRTGRHQHGERAIFHRRPFLDRRVAGADGVGPPFDVGHGRIVLVHQQAGDCGIGGSENKAYAGHDPADRHP